MDFLNIASTRTHPSMEAAWLPTGSFATADASQMRQNVWRVGKCGPRKAGPHWNPTTGQALFNWRWKMVEVPPLHPYQHSKRRNLMQPQDPATTMSFGFGFVNWLVLQWAAILIISLMIYRQKNQFFKDDTTKCKRPFLDSCFLLNLSDSSSKCVRLGMLVFGWGGGGGVIRGSGKPRELESRTLGCGVLLWQFTLRKPIAFVKNCFRYSPSYESWNLKRLGCRCKIGSDASFKSPGLFRKYSPLFCL